MTSYLEIPPPVEDPATGDRPSILVVDDDEMKRFALKRLLTPLGYPVVEAQSGPAALRCLLAQDFAAILLDVRMPGMDGLETAALIRTRARSRLTPILLTTASTSAEITASGMYPDSVTEFMFAPAEPDELRATISVFADLYLKAQELAAQAHDVQTSADRWRLLTQATPVGIFQTDRCHRYTYTNPRWSEITGIPAEAALGQDWRMIVDAEQASRLVVSDAATEVASRAEVSYRIEIPIPGTDPKIAQLTSKPIADGEGGIAAWVGSLTQLSAAVAREMSPRPPARKAVALTEEVIEAR